MTDRAPIIEVKNLTVSFGDNLVLDDISFDVYPGEIFVVLGTSGSGKTTLLRNMTGLMQPETGQVLFEGEDIISAADEARERLMQQFGVLFQSGALLGSMTLGDNIALPLKETTKLSRGTTQALVRMKLSQVGLQGKEHMMPAELSGGMKKRGGLARAMVLDPKILFFDEPSAGLDPITQAEIDNLILGLNANLGTTMIVVTHELQSIFTIAHRVIMLGKNTHKIIGEGTPADLRDHSAHPRVRAFFRREPLKDS